MECQYNSEALRKSKKGIMDGMEGLDMNYCCWLYTEHSEEGLFFMDKWVGWNLKSYKVKRNE